MARMTVESESLTRVADKIRQKNGGTEPLVFPDGFERGLDNICVAGEQSEYDRFWDYFQKSGTRTEYTFGFAGYGWNEKTFLPKYDMTPTRAYRMFYYFGQQQYTSTKYYSDLVASLLQNNVTLDFSKCTNLTCLFEYTLISRVGVISTLGVSALDRIFSNAKITTIDKLILKESGSQAFLSTFYKATQLTNLVIEGTIGRNGFNVQWSTKLSCDSIMSIIRALSGSSTGNTVTLSKVAVDQAFESKDGCADGSLTDSWADVMASKDNWTFNLV